MLEPPHVADFLTISGLPFPFCQSFSMGVSEKKPRPFSLPPVINSYGIFHDSASSYRTIQLGTSTETPIHGLACVPNVLFRPAAVLGELAAWVIHLKVEDLTNYGWSNIGMDKYGEITWKWLKNWKIYGISWKWLETAWIQTMIQTVTSQQLRPWELNFGSQPCSYFEAVCANADANDMSSF